VGELAQLTITSRSGTAAERLAVIELLDQAPESPVPTETSTAGTPA
jgi:hypothetical protein